MNNKKWGFITFFYGALMVSTATAAHLPQTDAASTKRYIIVHNDMTSPVYPVVEVPEDGNCRAGSTSVDRIVVAVGVAPGNTIKIYLPDKCWYNAGRVYLFTPDIESFEKRIDPTQQTQKGDTALCYEVNPDKSDGTGVNCYTGVASASYPLDSPAQLTEFTFDADDPETGLKSPDPDKGRLMTDIDVSYVDETFLPVSMAIDSGGLTGYMGTTLSYADFSEHIIRFLQLSGWSSFAAYTKENWQNNVFHDLIPFSYHTMGGYNLFNSVNTKATSALYQPKPATNTAYLIENLTVNPQDYQPSNPSVAALVTRWEKWLSSCSGPCVDPIPANPGVDQKAFCQDFQATVQWVWNKYKEYEAQDPNYCKFIGGDSKSYTLNEKQCLIEHIIGYKEGPNSGQIPESVQAILRGVPWNDTNSGKPLYQYDKWLLFWAPLDSPYNLDPFTRLIHDPDEGINALAYSFSIDDKYGNLRDAGNGLIIDVGGGSYLPNKTIFDPYQQYYVSWPAHDWDHAVICGRDLTINKQAGNSRISLWENGTKQDHCDVVLYSTANAASHLNFRLYEENARTVVDSYTGKQQQVQGLKMDLSYCKEQSSGDMASNCERAELSPILTGDIAYVSLSDADKPKTTLNVPALITGATLNLAPGWASATGCGLPAGAGNIDTTKGSSFPLQPGTATDCSVTLMGGTTDVKLMLNVSFMPNGNLDPSSVTCNKANQDACVGMYVDPNNIDLPGPGSV